MDKHAVKVVEGDKMGRHSPREFSQIAWYFLGCLKCAEEWHFHCSNKEQMKRLKELLNHTEGFQFNL